MNSWTLLGAGAIGGLLACQLTDAHIPVQLALRPCPDLPNQRRITLIRGDRTQTYTLPVLQPDQNIQQLILTTKTWQSQEALEPLQERLAEVAAILVIQNGMGITDWLLQQFPQATLLVGTTTQGAYREPPDRLIHAGIGDTWIGPLRNSDAEPGQQIIRQWQQQGMAVTWDDTIRERLWIKLGINCAINPLTVIYGCRNGELLQIPEALSLMESLCEEFTQVYQAQFQQLPRENLFVTARRVAEQTATNISSMRQDVLRGNPTEIEAINGYLAREARRYGIACPANETTLRRLRMQHQG